MTKSPYQRETQRRKREERAERYKKVAPTTYDPETLKQ